MTLLRWLTLWPQNLWLVAAGYAGLIWLWKRVLEIADGDEAALRQAVDHPRAWYSGRGA